MIFFGNHKNCSKEQAPEKMQTSHNRRRDCRTITNIPGISRISHATNGKPRNQGLVGVDGETLHMAQEEEV
ncbi:hypothetical protein TNCV_3151491 [Trichonephila clavipes]|nr:hypothetical protein TNCV_3151491 [Trichonephila clavipes]